MHKEDVIAHHGVKGQKWGVIRKKKQHGSRTTVFQKNITLTNGTVKMHGKAYDKYLIKQAKRKQRASGDAANLKYMTDAERKRYAKGRVKTMGNKTQAIRSESTNYLAKTGKTFAKGLGGTLVSALGTGTIGVATGEVGTFLASLALGSIPAAALTIGVTAGTAISRGVRMGKNINAIKNTGGKRNVNRKSR